MESKANDVSEHYKKIDLEITERDHAHFHVPIINKNEHGQRIDNTIIDISCNIQDWRGRGEKSKKTQDQNQNRDKANVEANNYNHDLRCQESGTMRKTLFQPTIHNKSHGGIAGGEHGNVWETRERRESNQESFMRKQQEKVCTILYGSNYFSHVSEFQPYKKNIRRDLKPCQKDAFFPKTKYSLNLNLIRISLIYK
jgi:hypothetical protein